MDRDHALSPGDHKLANCLFIRAVSKVLFAQEVSYLTLITVAMLSQLATVRYEIS